MPCTNHPEVMEGLNGCTRCGKKFCGDCLVELKGGFFCAACKAEEVKDIQSGLGTTGELKYGGFWIRLGAYIIDNIFLGICGFPIGILMGLSGIELRVNPDGSIHAPAAYWIVQLLMMAANMAYFALMHQFKGATLGKMACNLKVVTPDGKPITAGQAWTRVIMQLVASIPLLATYWAIIFTKEKTGIHDMVAKTRVIRTRP